MRNHHLTASALIAALALLLMLGGAVALWGNAQKDDDGYFSTGSDRLATTTRALTTEGLDVGLDGPGWLMDTDSLGKVRLTVDPHADKPVFVGIAHTRDVSRYLRQSAHATVTDVSYSPFRAAYRTHGGERRPGSPGDQGFWATSAQGSGPQQLTWDVEHGSWSIVVMNADASPGVDAGVSAGANVPILSTIAWSLLGAGLLLLAASGALVLAGARRSGVRFRDRSR